MGCERLTYKKNKTPLKVAYSKTPFFLKIGDSKKQGSPKKCLSAYKYKYNGKEYQDELDLNWYDYGARNSDPAVIPFTTIDPRAEDYYSQSPYAFASNNPVLYVDINGEGVDDIVFYNTKGNEVHRVKSDTVHEMYLVVNDSGNESHNTITTMIQGANTVETAHMYTTMASSEFSEATSMSIEFSGDAEESRGKDSLGRQRYMAEGALSTSVGFANGSEIEIQSVNANSGPWGFGPTPNGDYEGSRIVNTRESGMVRDGVGFKVYMSDNTQLNRDGLRIHPDQNPSEGTAGCIGIAEPSANLKQFRNNITTFLGNHNLININVNITNNPNYNRSVGGRQNSGE